MSMLSVGSRPRSGKRALQRVFGSGISDGDKGDIIVSASGTSWLFDSAVVTAAAKTVLDDASISAMRTTLGLAIGTNVQAWDTDLDTWAAIARAGGFDTFVAAPSSANLAALLTDETGSGANVFATSPTLVTPILGVAAATQIAVSPSAALPTTDWRTLAIKTAGSFGGGIAFNDSAFTAAWYTNTTTVGKVQFAVNDGASGLPMTPKFDLTATEMRPTSNDGYALGTTALSFSDLFLATGGVLNWNNGDYTLTHSSGILTANKDIQITTPGAASASAVTVGGTQTLTNKTLTSPTITTPVLNGTPTGTGVATAPTASTLALRDANGLLTSVNMINGFTTTATAAGTTTMTVASNFIQVWTGSSTQTVKLPTTSVAQGQQYLIINQSTGAVTVQSSGANTITILAAGTWALFTAVVATPTTAANWDSRYDAMVATSGKSLSVSNSLTLAGTDGTTLTFQATGTVVNRDSTDTLTNKTFDTAGAGNSLSINGVAATTNAGTGAVVRATSPTIVTPTIAKLANLTSNGLITTSGGDGTLGITVPATGILTLLATPSSANLAAAITDETGSGALVFANSPTLVTPALGTPASGVATNLTGLPTIGGLMGQNQTLCVFRPQQAESPASIYGVFTVRNAHPILGFDDTTNWNSIFSSVMPKQYTARGVTVIITWLAASATSGDVVWNAYFERDDIGGQNMDSDGFASAQTTTTTTNGTNGLLSTTSIAFTSGAQMDSVVAGEFFRLKVERNAASGSDTMVGNAQIVMIEVRES